MSGHPAARRVAALSGLLALTYLLALTALFPAERAWRLIEPRLGAVPDTAVQGIAGTVWSGSADSVRMGGIPLGRLSWRMQPTALLGGWLGLRLRAESGGDSVDLGLRLRPGALQVRDGSASFSAARLRDALDLPLLLEGRMDFVITRLAYDGSLGFRAADGSAAWRGAGGGLPQPVPLGDYRALLEAGNEGWAHARIESVTGSPLQAEGRAGWHPSRGHEVDLLLRSEAPSILTVLDSLAARQPDGSYRLRLDHR